MNLTSITHWRSSLLRLATLTAVGAAGSAHAQLYWDANGSAAGAGTPAAGTWDTGTNWTATADGTGTPGAWVDGQNVIFSAGAEAAGTWAITLAGPVQTHSITFNGTANTVHNISGGSIDIGTTGLSLTATAAGGVGGRAKTISSDITGSGGLTIAANGDTSATGGGSNTIFSITGNNTYLGDTTITAGVVGYVSNFGDVSNKVVLNGGGLVFNTTGSFARNIEFGANGGVLRNYGSATSTLSGELSGAGELRRTDGGTAILTHPSGSFTGPLSLLRGTTQLGTGVETTVPLANAGNIAIGDATTAATLRYQVDASSTLLGNVSLPNVSSAFIWQGAGSDDELTVSTTLGTSATLGTIRASSGSIRFTTGASAASNRLEIGSLPANNAAAVVGHIAIEDGAAITTSFFDIGSGSNQAGTVDQTGGTVTLPANSTGVRIGHWANGATPGSIYNLSGGVLDASAANVPLNVGWDGAGTLNVSGTGTAKAWRLYVDASGADNPGIVNLEEGGTIEVGAGGIANDGTAGSQLNLKGGVLRSTASSTWASKMELSGASGTTFDLNTGTTTVVSGVISGSGDLIVSGSGHLSVTALNTFTGSFYQPPGSTLSGNGRIIAASSLDGTVNPGTIAGGVGTLDFGDPGVPTIINGDVILDLDPAGVSASSDLISTFDALHFGSASTLTVNFPAPPTESSYTLFSYGGILTGAPMLESSSTIRGVDFSLDTSTPGTIRLLVAGSPTPQTVTWAGDGATNLWDANTSPNWNNNTDNFFQLDSVVFDDTGNNDTVITLSGNLKPAALTFNGSKNYTFAGSGQISSGATLNIAGTSTVTLDAKARLGALSIPSGSLVIKDNTDFTGTGNITLGTDASFVVDRSNALTFSRAFNAGSTGTFVKNGTGNLTLGGGFLLLPTKLTVNQGTLTVTGSGFSGDRLQGNGIITINSGATVIIPAGNAHAFGGNNATMTESFVINGGTFTVNQEQYLNKLTLNGGTINGTADIRSSTGGNLWTVTGTTPSTISTAINNFNNTNFAVENVTGDSQPDLIATGNVTGGSGIVKSGAGTLRIGGASNNYTGSNTVNAGTLQLGSNTALGFGGAIGNAAVGITTVNAGGILDLNGTTVNEAITLNGGSLINSHATTTGTLSNGIAGIRITAVGAGYTAAPTLTFTGGGGTGVTATTAIASNALSSITTTAPGSGYSSAPTVTVTGTSTTEATAAALISSITLNASTANTIGGSGNLSVSAVITGSGNLTKIGSGTLTLPAPNSTFTGAFTIDAGTVAVTGIAGNTSASPTSLGSKDPARLITVNTNGTLAFNSNNVFGGGGQTAAALPSIEVRGILSTTRFNTIGNLVLNGGTLTNSSTDTGGYQGFQFIGSVTTTGPSPSTITSTNGKASHLLGGATTVFNVTDVTGNPDADLIVANPINNGSTDYAGVASLEKTGAGTLHLQAANNYTGTTTVTAGTIKGATTLAGPLHVTAAGTIAPGNSTGTMAAGATTLAGAYACEIDGAGSDLLNVTGDLNLTGSTLNVQVLAGGATQPAYIIAKYTGNLTGTFTSVNNLPSGYTVDYAYNDGSSTKNIALVSGGTQPPYTTWAAANGIAGAGANVDSDGDGIANGIEFVIGGDPSGPNSNSLHLLPTVAVDATYLNFTFRRTAESAGYDPYVQYGSNLTGWTTAEGGENGVLIEETADGFGDGIDLVVVKIPRTLASGQKIFARLAVDIDDN